MAQYIYIAQSSMDAAKCKVGKTTNLEHRLQQYNRTTGVAVNTYRYLFACEVVDATAVENDFKIAFGEERENPKREIYFYNEIKFANYVKFLKSHAMFVKEIVVEPKVKVEVVKKEVEIVVKKTTPSLKSQGKSKKDIMQEAKSRKNDEFYTRYEDVEKEISMYPKDLWHNKVVFCNCDDAVDDDERKCSAFSLYFLKRFKELGLKKLICTHYSGGWDIFSQGKKAYIAYVCIYEQSADGYVKRIETPPNYDGSFDHPLSVEILRNEADIVCTNPPFSKARQYWKLLIDSGKQFLIISNITNPITGAYIPYFMENKVRPGYHSVDKYLDHKKGSVSAAGHWYTNLPVLDRPKYRLLKIVRLQDIPADSKEYDDKKILIVKNGYIPKDYEEPFSVSSRQILNGLLEKGYKIVQEKRYEPYKNDERLFARVIVQKVE